MKPRRIQRKRTKGWRMPGGAVYVGRPTRWGNPWRPKGDDTAALSTVACAAILPLREPALSRAACVLRFAFALGLLDPTGLSEVLRRAWADDVLPFTQDDARRDLRGKDLVCWCRLDRSCHADVLLVVANRA